MNTFSPFDWLNGFILASYTNILKMPTVGNGIRWTVSLIGAGDLQPMNTELPCHLK